MPETPLLSYLRIQTATDRDILAALRTASVGVNGELRRLQSKTGVGNKMRKEQLLRSQATINRQLGTYFEKVGKTVEAATAKAAAAGAESILRESEKLLSNVLSKADYDTLARSAQQSAVQSLSTLERRVEGSSYIPLSEQVYNTQALTTGKVDDIVNSAIARGASAAELAKDVRKYINPNTPGGVRYASMRLGRTELNNAFHASQIKEAQDAPWVDALQWHLSGSHPVPDECNTYADRSNFKGGGAGVFKPEEVPAKPHPNCLCFTTPVTPSREDFVNAFMKGDYDKHLDDMGLQGPVEQAKAAVVKAAPKAAHKVSESSIKDAVQNVNPGYGPRTIGGKTRNMFSSVEASVNCQKTAYATELRMRGQKVVAQEGIGRKTSIGDMKAMWKPRPGETATRGFSGSTREDLIKRIRNDPEGSRYMMMSEWKDGGSHVFNAVKLPDGSLRFFDSQRKMLNATDEYLVRAKKLEGFRIDNLVPASKHRGYIIEEKAAAVKAAPKTPTLSELEKTVGKAASERERLSATTKPFGAAPQPKYGVSLEQKQALDDYTYSSFVSMNKLKRDPASLAREPLGSSRIQQAAKDNELLESLIKQDQFALREDITVARGIRVSKEFDPGIVQVGDLLADPAFLSVTSDFKKARDFAAGRSGLAPVAGDVEGWTYITKVPKGTHAVQGKQLQSELIFKPGTRQRVTGKDIANRIIYTEVY